MGHVRTRTTRNWSARRTGLRSVALLIVAVSGMASSSTRAADVRVFSGGAPQETLQVLRPEFEKQSGHRVVYTFAHVSIIQKKLAAGEQTDVILLPMPLMSAVEKIVALRPEGRLVLARIGIGVLVRDGDKRPDISTSDGVRRMLLGARTIAVPQPDGLTGSHLMRMMVGLGIADAVRPKLRHKPAIDGAGDLVATGEADVGLYLASEILSVKGATLVGLLPAELQNYVVYSIAVPVHAAVPEPALAYVRFISSAANREHWKATGFELVEGNK
jgi:molybdate transport system substrate-binding protein